MCPVSGMPAVQSRQHPGRTGVHKIVLVPRLVPGSSGAPCVVHNRSASVAVWMSWWLRNGIDFPEGMEVAMSTAWPGTQREYQVLARSVARNCACEVGRMGVRTTTCAAHRMLQHEPHTLVRLLFMRRIVDRLQRREWCSEEETS